MYNPSRSSPSSSNWRTSSSPNSNWRNSSSPNSNWRTSSSPNSNWRNNSPRRTTPYSLRSLAHRLNQTGPIEDSLFSARSTNNSVSFDDLPEDLSVEQHTYRLTTPALASTRGQTSTNQMTRNDSQAPVSTVPSTTIRPSPLRPLPVSPGVDLSNEFFTTEPNKPQFLKKSPFSSFSAAGTIKNGDNNKNGATGYISSHPKLSSPQARIAAPKPLTSTPPPQDMFSKWAASFGCAKSPTLSPSPQAMTTEQTTNNVTISRASSSTSGFGFVTSASNRASVLGDEQPINLSRPSSIVHSTRATPNDDNSPLDLRSPSITRTTTPATPTGGRTPAFFTPTPSRNEKSPFCSSPFLNQRQNSLSRNQDLQTHKFGASLLRTDSFRSLRSNGGTPATLSAPSTPVLPGSTPPRSSTGLSSKTNGPLPIHSAKDSAAASPTTEILQETTKRLHSMNLRSHKSHQQQSFNTKVSSQPQSKRNRSGAVTNVKETGCEGITPQTKSAPPKVNQKSGQITLHYPTPPPPPPQQQSRLQPLPFRGGNVSIPHIQKPLLLPTPPPMTTFHGLSTKVVETSFSVVLTDKLEENYLKCRNLVISKEGCLITPYKFLSMLCNRMQMNIHAETFRFCYAANDIQFRTELYVGGFCGVGHALSIGFSKQLAAAHVLERMRAHFRGIKQTMYALFPGSRHTKIGEKLESLCQMYDLGEVRMVYKDRQQQHQQIGGYGLKRRGGGNWNTNHLEVRWECSCFVKKFQAIALSDHMLYGGFQAAKDMYLNFVKPPEVPVVQIKDYFAVGVDCPMLKDIHCSLLLNRPSINKLQWMEEYQVPPSEMDAVLHDPMNNSKYLMSQQILCKRSGRNREDSRRATLLEGNKLIEFRRNLEEALEWIQTTIRRTNLQGMRFRKSGRNYNAVAAMETEVLLNGNEVDENDAEVEDIFHDATMEVEIL